MDDCNDLRDSCKITGFDGNSALIWFHSSSYPNLFSRFLTKSIEFNNVQVPMLVEWDDTCSPYQSVDIRDELVFLGDMTTESLQESIKSCSNEIIGDVCISLE